MTWPRLFLLALLVATPVVAQQTSGLQDTADAYAQAAELFIDGETEQAEAAAVAGLQAAPGDAKLQALLDLIRQQQPPQDGGGGEQNEDDSESESGDEGDPESQGGQQDRPEDESQQAEQDQTRSDAGDGDEGESSETPEGARPGEGGETPQQDAPVPQGQMSAEQASRILDAVGGEERLLLRELRRRPARVRRSDKDW